MYNEANALTDFVNGSWGHSWNIRNEKSSHTIFNWIKKLANVADRYPYDIIHTFRFFDLHNFESSEKNYAAHPWCHHAQYITQIFKDTRLTFTKLREWYRTSFCCRCNYSGKLCDSGKFCEALKISIPKREAEDTLYEFANELRQYAKKICSIINLLQEGNYYSKAWAVELAIHWYYDLSNASAIDAMIANKHVPRTSKRLLSNLINLKKKGKFIIDDEWKGVGNNRRRGLKLALVTQEMWYQGSYCDVSLYKPPKVICLQDYFGLRKDVRLYFSPKQFPTPFKLVHGDCCDSWYDLRSYIVEQSKKEGEVTTTGGVPGKSVRFSCKKRHCKFYFWLKWNRYGYYIHHYNEERLGGSFIGCLVHNH